MLRDKIKCTVKLTKDWKSPLKAYLAGFVPCTPYEYKPLSGSNVTIKYTQEALVVLHTFDEGAIYQLPLNLVEVDMESMK